MKLPDPINLVFKPIAGADRVDVFRQAIALAAEYSCDVEFDFNGKWYGVKFGSLFAQVGDMNKRT